MIHVIITQNQCIRDVLVTEYGLSRVENMETYRSNGIIVVYRESLDETIISHVIEEYVADTIWIVGVARVVSNEHELGDIVMPNVFLKYDHEIDGVEFNKENQDSFLHDPFFLHHYEEQSDLDFESFGLSIGGIAVTKQDGMDSVEREQVEFAYSADCIDEICYPLIAAADKLDRAESVYPVLAIIWQESDVSETIRIVKNIPPVLTYLQTRLSNDSRFDEDEEEDDETDFNEEN